MVEDPSNKVELLKRIESSRQALLARLSALDHATMVEPLTDGGWSVKDHVAHIAAWERYLAAMLTGANRWTEMGLTAAPDQLQEFEINWAIYEANRELSIAEVAAIWDSAHDRVLEVLARMSEEDLLQPFSHYVPDATGDSKDDPIFAWVNGNTWGHYEEHAGWIEDALARRELASPEEDESNPQTIAELIAALEVARASLLGELAGLDDAALSAPCGPDGWAIKDHLTHLAAWERGVTAMLHRRDRWNGMGLTDAQAERAESTDDINDLLYQSNKAHSAAEALAEFEAAHQAMLDALTALTDYDLDRPYDYFVPGAADPQSGPPIREIINNNSWGHYMEHLPWIADALQEAKSA